MSRRADRARASRSRNATIAELVRAAVGVAHLVVARRAAGQSPRRPAGSDIVGFYRILGVRQIVQAVLLIRVGSGNAHTLGALVDGTHAVSMVPLLVVDRRRRRLALRQIAVALAFAVMEVTLVGPDGRSRS